MTREEELEQFIRDADAFIEWWTKDQGSSHTAHFVIAQTLSHDISGLKNRKLCFVPRVTGYAKKEAV